MVDTVDMVDMDIMVRDLLKLMLSQDISEAMAAMVTAVDMVMEAMDMDVDTMARGRLKPKLLLKLMLSQDTSEAMAAMDMAVDMVMEAMDMDVDTMARGRLKLKLLLKL